MACGRCGVAVLCCGELVSMVHVNVIRKSASGCVAAVWCSSCCTAVVVRCCGCGGVELWCCTYLCLCNDYGGELCCRACYFVFMAVRWCGHACCGGCVDGVAQIFWFQ